MFPRLLFQGFFHLFSLKKTFFKIQMIINCVGVYQRGYNVFRPHIRKTVWKYKFLNNEYKLPIQKNKLFYKMTICRNHFYSFQQTIRPIRFFWNKKVVFIFKSYTYHYTWAFKYRSLGCKLSLWNDENRMYMKCAYVRCR